ncbi:MAG: superoxide dismutase [Oscillospiraceae bacterium]|jgi:Fe-Mn family superoxide dismutase|nr:superoxide dismutase [Oscillospiraceae bacterium]
MNQQYPWPLLPLPYAYQALEPYIDAPTMHLHHDRHLRTYVDDLNAALARYPQLQTLSLQQLILHADRLPADIKTTVLHSAGGVYNHEFFFSGMTPGGRPPTGRLAQLLARTYGSFAEFQKEFKTLALAVFGSGYAWLCADPRGGLTIFATANQVTPLTQKLLPLICIDVWEHAYYLKHYNLRADYVDDWFRVADFGRASELYG